MSRILILLVALAAWSPIHAQTASSPLESLEMDVLNPGEKPDQALERMSTRAKPDYRARGAEPAALEERPVAYGRMAIATQDKRELGSPAADRAQDRKREREREREKDDGHDDGDGEDKDHED